MQVVVVPEQAELAPGQQVDVEVAIANDGAEPVSPVIDVTGVDPDLVTLPPDIVALSPGERITAVVGIRLPEDAIPGESRWAVRVSDATGLQRPVAATVHVKVGTRPDVAIELIPAAIKGRRKAKLETVLRNRSDDPQLISLDGSGEGVHVDFAADEVELAPREEVRVRTTVTRAARSWLREVRHGALIDVAGTGMPVSAVATYTQKPLLPVWSRKLIALVTVLSLWASTVYVVNNTLLGDPPPPDLIAGEEETEPDTGDADLELVDGVPTGPPLVVKGTIDGPRDLSGTTVILERIAFGDEGTVEQAGVRLAALTPVAIPKAQVIERVETTTDEGGRFRIAGGLAPDAFYRVTAARAGFETASVVITTSLDDPEIDIPIELLPADGAMSGRAVDGGNRPLSGVDITVTDGTLEFRTTTDGGGNWSLSGLTTPANYQVIAELEGYSTATSVVELDGGQSRGGITQQLFLGRGTIRGLVSYRGAGIGAVTVEITGEEDRTTTTLTDPGLEGRFDVPALPMGVYQLTFSANGWLTKTTEVIVDRGDVPLLVDDLRPSTAVVQGTVLQKVAPGGGCRFPDPDIPSERENAVAEPCGGVGVRMVSGDRTYSTTTSSGNGFFQITGIEAGTYVVSFERYGYFTEFYEVQVSAGDIISIPNDVGDPEVVAGPTPAGVEPALQLASMVDLASHHVVIMQLLPSPTDNIGEITGVIRDSREPGEVLNHDDLPEPPVITVDNQPNAEVELLADGAFSISRLLPGAHTVRIAAVGYDIFEFVARVGRDAPADAGLLNLRPFASLNMRVVNQAEEVVPGLDVFVTSDDPALIARLNDRNADPTFDVRSCTVRRDTAGRWRLGEAGVGEDEQVGLCATVNDSGEAFMNQALPTGRYTIISPVNADDIADDAPPEVRASTVPLDHEQLFREIDVVSGATERPELRMRRYAIIQGRLQDEQRISINEDVFARTPEELDALIQAFPSRVDGVGFELRGLLNGPDRFTPPEGLRPRVSFGAASGLPEGVYRINRVLPDSPGLTRQYELEFHDRDGKLARLLVSNDAVVEGLQFGQTRIANAVLAPRPMDIRLRTVWERENGVRVPVDGPAGGFTGQLSGVTEFIFLDGNPVPIRETVELAVDNQGALTTVSRFFGDDFARPMRFVSGRDLTVLLQSPDQAAFYGPPVASREADPTQIRVSAEAFDEVDLDDINDRRWTQIRIRDNESDPPLFTSDLVLEPLPRSIAGQVTVELDEPDLEEFLSDRLSAELLVPTTTTGDTAPRQVATVSFGTDGSFTIPDIRPDEYHLLFSGGAGQFTLERAVPVAPGPAAEPVVVDPFTVIPFVNATMTVTETFDSEVLDVEDVRVELITNGDIVGPDGTVLFSDGSVVASQTTDTQGEVTFTGIPGGGTVSYEVRLSKPGYQDGPALVGDVTQTDVRFRRLDNTLNTEIIRFGEVRGLVSLLVDAVGRQAGEPRDAFLGPQSFTLTATYGPSTDTTETSTTVTSPFWTSVDGSLVTSPSWSDPDWDGLDSEPNFTLTNVTPTSFTDVRSTPSVGSHVAVVCGPADGTAPAGCTSGDVVASTTVTTPGLDIGEFLIGGSRGQEIPDGEHRLVVSRPDRHATIVVPIVVESRQVSDVGERFVLANTATLSGTVTGDELGAPSDHNPLANVQVEAGTIVDGGFIPLIDTDGVTATTMTNGQGEYTLPNLPPLGELGETVYVRFTEFADASATIETSRYVQEIEVELLAGDDNVDGSVELVGQFRAIAGQVNLETFTGGPGLDLDRAGVVAGDIMVTVTCQDDEPCADLVATTTLNTGEVTGTESTVGQDPVDGAVGFYEFPVLPVGTYLVEISAPGFDTTSTTTTVARSVALVDGRTVRPEVDDPPPIGTEQTVHLTMTATPVEVRVPVVSADLGGVTPTELTGAPITVSATYRTLDGSNPTTPPLDGYVFATPTDPSTGIASLLLPPGEWDFSTTGASEIGVLPRPHVDAASRSLRTVRVATTGAAEVADPVDLAAYLAVMGTIYGSSDPFADSGDPLAGVTVTVGTTGTEGAVYAFVPTGTTPTELTYQPLPGDTVPPSIATGVDGRWGLLLPPPATPNTVSWRLDVLAPSHGDARIINLDLDAVFSDRIIASGTTDATVTSDDLLLPAKLVADGILLTETPDPTFIELQTSTPTGETITGTSITVTATPEDDRLDPSSRTVDTDTGQVSFTLLPGTWTLTTTGGADDFVDRVVSPTIDRPEYGPQAIVVPISDNSSVTPSALTLVPRSSLRVEVETPLADVSNRWKVEVYLLGSEACPATADARVVDFESERLEQGDDFSRAHLVPQAVLLRFTEFNRNRGINLGNPTGRTALVCLDDLEAGSENLVIGDLQFPADTISGRVLGRPLDDDRLLASGVGGALVELLDNEDLVASATTETDPDALGSYFLSGVADGDYDLRITAFGYEDLATPLVKTSAALTGREDVLSAVPSELVIPLRSDSGDLSGIENGVTFTLSTEYDRQVPNGLITLTRTASTIDTGGDTGVATLTFDSVPPGTWTLSTTGLTGLDEPHRELAEFGPFVVPFADADPAPTVVAAEVELTRFALVEGQILARSYPAGATSTLETATFTAVTEATPELTVVQREGAGFRVWAPTPTTVTLTAENVGYADAVSTVTFPTDWSDNRVVQRDVVLTAEPIDVDVELRNDAGIEVPEETTITAVYVPAADDNTPYPTASFTLDTLAAGATTAAPTLNLAPGRWTFAVDGAFQLVNDADNAGFELLLDVGQESVATAARVTLANDTISGQVTGVPLPGLDLAAEELVGATVTLFTGATIEGGVATRTVETDASGRYLFDGIPDGDYWLSFEADGYVTSQTTVTLGGSAQIVDPVLVGRTSMVEVVLTSDLGDLSGLDAGNLRLEAAYDLAGGGTTTVTTTVSTLAVGTTTATATYASVPPGTWTFSTVGLGGLDQPHQNDEVVVEVRGDGAKVDGALPLERFALITGQVLGRSYDGGPTVTIVTATLTADTGGVPMEQPERIDYPLGDGDATSFRVWVRNPMTVTLTAETVDYGTADVAVDGDFGGDRTVATDVVITAAPVPVALSVRNASGEDLGTLQLRAEYEPAVGFDAPDPLATTTSATVDDTFDWAFDLAPGTWTFTTDDPTYQLVASGTTESYSLTIQVGGDAVAAEVDIILANNIIAGDVTGVPLDDPELQATALEGATVTLFTSDPVDDPGLAASATTTTDESGRYRFTDLTADTVYWLRFEAVGYDPVVSSRTLESTALTDVDARLIGSTSEVQVVLTSSGGILDGFDDPNVVFEAEYPTGTGTKTVTTTVATAVSGGVATATFASVPPGTWTFSTVGLTDLDEPHEDVAPRVIEVDPLAAQPIVDMVTVQRYVELSGVITTRRADDAEPEQLLTPLGEVTISDATGTVATAAVETAGTATYSWSTFVLPGSGEVTVTFDPEPLGAFTGATTTTRTVTITDISDIDLGFTAKPVDVTLILENATDTTVTVTNLNATLVEPASNLTVTETFTTSIELGPNATGSVTTSLAPGTWALSADDHTFAPDQIVVLIEAGAPPVSFDVEVNSNSKLFGLVAEDRGGMLVPLSGVHIQAERDGQRFSTTSGLLNALNENYQLQAQAGTWRITATRNGRVHVIDEAFEIRRDGTFDGRNLLDIVLPWMAAQLSGQVTDGSGSGVAGAVVTAVANGQVVTSVSDEDGAYLLEGLDPDLTWAVTFTPPDGAEGVPVTRFIAPGGRADVGLVLDQQLASGYGELEVIVTGALPGDTLGVTLSETNPFPTLSADGELATTVVADADGTAAVLFDRLIPGDGRSIPQDRFTVTVEASGATQTRSGLEVLAGMTTTVEVALNLDLSRTVDLEVRDADGPVTDRTVRLERDSSVLTAIAEPGSNVYRFARVDPGTWAVMVDGYLPASIDVPAGGDDTLVAQITLVVDPDAPEPDGDGEVSDPDGFEPEDGGTTGTDGTVDDGSTSDEGGSDGTGDGSSPQPPADGGNGDDDGDGDGSGNGDGSEVEGSGTGDGDAPATEDPGDDGVDLGSNGETEATATTSSTATSSASTDEDEPDADASEGDDPDRTDDEQR